MKKLLLLSVCLSFAMANCTYKIQKLEKELEYAKKYNNRNKEINIQRALDKARAHCDAYQYKNSVKNSDKLESLMEEKEKQIDAIEDELDKLSDFKDSMSKVEYERRKAELKAKKKLIKEEYKRQKHELKNNF